MKADVTVELTVALNLEKKIDSQDEFVYENPNPVLSFEVEGGLSSVNPAALNLMQELGLKYVNDLLPDDHCGLVKACQKTRTTLTSKNKICGRNIVWSYQPAYESDTVFIYGYDISKYKPQMPVQNVLPKLNPSPIILSTVEGVFEFANPAVSSLLNDLILNNVTDMLPINHLGLLKAALKTQVLLTEERSINGTTIAWTYKLSESNGSICINGYDISHSTSKMFSIEGMPRFNVKPVVSADTDGVPRFINYATSAIINKLGFNSVEDILPKRHSGLIKACLTTNTPLIEEYQTPDRSIYWSYHPIEGSNYIYMCGHAA